MTRTSRRLHILPHLGITNPAQRKLLFEACEDRLLMALVSWWTADNTAADSTGTNNGTLISGATYATGQINQAFQFDGINDRVGVPDSSSFQLTQSLSIEGWIKVNAISPTTGGVILFRGDDRGGLDPYTLSVEPNGTLKFGISSLTQGASISATISIGQFVHVAATLDDATGVMKLYENGVLVSQGVTSVRPFAELDPASNPAVGIGNHGGYPSTPHNFPFNGLIDELKLYNEALSSDQVLAIFNAGKGDLRPGLTIDDTIVTEGESALKYLQNFASPMTPNRMIYDAFGNLYVTTLAGNSVLRYNSSGVPFPAPGKSGAEFISPDAGISIARDIAFGPGGIYVVSENTDSILKFDQETGEPLGAFIAPGAGGLDQPRGLLFHGGYLYVTSVGGVTAAPGLDSVLRYDAVTGAPAGDPNSQGGAVFIPSGLNGLDNPSQIAFHNGAFYVASTSPSTSNSILRFATNGSSLGAFVPTGSGGLAGPANFLFKDGYLYVASWTNNKVLRYDATTGAFISEVVSGDGLVTPLSILFEPNGNLLVTSRDTNEIRRYGDTSDAVFVVRLTAPFPTTVSVNYSTADGSALQRADYTAVSGTLTFAPGETAKAILVPIIPDTVLEPDETFNVNLAGESLGSVIVDRQGVGTILDGQPGRINTTSAGAQVTTILPINYNPLETNQAVAMDSAGNYVVAWSGNGAGEANGIFFQRFDRSSTRLGGETRANVTTANPQTNPVVGRALSNGKFAIAWNSANGVYGRVFNADGTAASNEITIVAGSSSTQNYVDSIAMDNDGDFVVLYKQLVRKGIGESRYLNVQRFNAAGQAQGSAIRVTTLNLINGQAGVASDANGNFVVVWDDGPINAQRFTSAGKKLGSLINVNSDVTGEIQWQSNVGRDADGDFVVTWVVRKRDAANNLTYDHYAQVLNKDGAKRGIAVVTHTTSIEMPSSIAVQATGDFVLSWTDSTASTGTDVYAQRFNLNGVATDTAHRVNPTVSGNQERPSAAVDSTGNYVVVWNTPAYQPNGASTPILLDSDVHGRRFQAPADPLMAAAGTGTASGGEIIPGQNLEAIVAEAIDRWNGTGLSMEQQELLGNIQVNIADLDGATLGLANGQTIWLDTNAAGWGWFVDATPIDDSEFILDGDQGEQGHIDLLTVVLHELGHLLGNDHDEDSIMAETLATGVRISELEANDAQLDDVVMASALDQQIQLALEFWLSERLDSDPVPARRRLPAKA